MSFELLPILATSGPAGIYLAVIVALALYTYKATKDRELQCSIRLKELELEKDALKEEVHDLKRQLDNMSLRLELLLSREK